METMATNTMIGKIISLKLAPYIGDGNNFSTLSFELESFSSFETSPVYRGRKRDMDYKEDYAFNEV